MSDILTEGELRRLAWRVIELRKKADELISLGYDGMATELIRDAADLMVQQVTVEHQCIVHKGPFTSTWAVSDAPTGAIEASICGPCSAMGARR